MSRAHVYTVTVQYKSVFALVATAVSSLLIIEVVVFRPSACYITNIAIVSALFPDKHPGICRVAMMQQMLRI